jgi:lysozyme
MKLTQAAVDLVKHFEGKRLKAYLDPVGVVTIGYGYTNRAGFGPGVKKGDTWTEEKADEMLRRGLEMFGEKIRPHIKARATDEQFGAFVSLAYNIGWQSFIRSTALKRFNAGDVAGCAEAMLWWNKSGGKVMRGLVRRREAEVSLFWGGGAHKEDMANVTPDPERSTPAKSTTIQAATGAAATGVGTAAYAVGQLDSTAQLVVIGGAVLICIFALWIAKERLRKWAEGVR